jgi:CRP-like cAMP-binding protein
MPVTARRSKSFYDRLGEAVTNELVDWLNQVDATYRSDLRELNEQNFARFDAKLEQRFAQHDAKLEQRFAQFDTKMEQRFAQADAKLERGLADLRTELRVALAALDAKIDSVNDRTVARLDAALLKQTRFFFLAWASLLAAIISLRS